MNLVLTRKKIIMTLSLLCLVIVSFLAGFWSSQRLYNHIPVVSQRLVPIYKVARPDQKIAVTLDGTWGADYTAKLLDIFKQYDLTITFFFAGYWLEEYPEIARQIAQAGHEIENHSYTHPHCTQITTQKLKQELEDTSQLIKDLTGRWPRFFRPPFGEYNNQVIQTTRDLNYQIVQWSIDSLDWQEPGVDFIVDRILDQVSAGDIILMHNNAPHTPQALKQLIPKLQQQGFEIVSLSELIYHDNYYIQSHDGLQVKSEGSE